MRPAALVVLAFHATEWLKLERPTRARSLALRILFLTLLEGLYEGFEHRDVERVARGDREDREQVEPLRDALEVLEAPFPLILLHLLAVVPHKDRPELTHALLDALFEARWVIQQALLVMDERLDKLRDGLRGALALLDQHNHVLFLYGARDHFVRAWTALEHEQHERHFLLLRNLRLELCAQRDRAAPLVLPILDQDEMRVVRIERGALLRVLLPLHVHHLMLLRKVLLPRGSARTCGRGCARGRSRAGKLRRSCGRGRGCRVAAIPAAASAAADFRRRVEPIELLAMRHLAPRPYADARRAPIAAESLTHRQTRQIHHAAVFASGKHPRVRRSRGRREALLHKVLQRQVHLQLVLASNRADDRDEHRRRRQLPLFEEGEDCRLVLIFRRHDDGKFCLGLGKLRADILPKGTIIIEDDGALGENVQWPRTLSLVFLDVHGHSTLGTKRPDPTPERATSSDHRRRRHVRPSDVCS